MERHLHPTLPGMSKQELLESMTRDTLVDHILALGARAIQIETDMNMAADALAGAYGVTVVDVLEEREMPDGAA